MNIKRIILLILIIIWMITVFCFSSEDSKKSGNTSGKVTEQVVEIMNKNIPKEEKLKKVKEYHPIVRKIAHVTLYTIGGILFFLFVNTYKISLLKKVIYAIIIGIAYATTDEFHQSLVPRKKSTIIRCVNRYCRNCFAE